MMIAARYRLPVQVTSTRRSLRDQRVLYARYLAGRNPYPVAPPGSSDHELGLAFDVGATTGPRPSPYLAWLGAIWQAMGGQWSPNDEVHFGIR